MNTTFAKIKLHGRFMYRGIMFERQHGMVAIRVDLIGMGHVGFPMDLKTKVKKID
jgi:hypothetical protein